eukprot:SM000009S23548  [mRNA]  locus=s9:596862:599219:- [translate_table: standard]
MPRPAPTSSRRLGQIACARSGGPPPPPDQALVASPSGGQGAETAAHGVASAQAEVGKRAHEQQQQEEAVQEGRPEPPAPAPEPIPFLTPVCSQEPAVAAEGAAAAAAAAVASAPVFSAARWENKALAAANLRAYRSAGGSLDAAPRDATTLRGLDADASVDLAGLDDGTSNAFSFSILQGASKPGCAPASNSNDCLPSTGVVSDQPSERPSSEVQCGNADTLDGCVSGAQWQGLVSHDEASGIESVATEEGPSKEAVPQAQTLTGAQQVPRASKVQECLQPAQEVDESSGGRAAGNVDPCAPASPVFMPRSSNSKGLLIIEDFLSPQEEESLMHALDVESGNGWRPSTINGRHFGKQYGVMTSIRTRSVSKSKTPMPGFLNSVLLKMRSIPQLYSFCPNGANAMDYRRQLGHSLQAHVDDRQKDRQNRQEEDRRKEAAGASNNLLKLWRVTLGLQLSGTLLVNVSLGGACYMTYARERGPKDHFKVLLKPRSLQIVAGESRYSFTHAILNGDLLAERRVSLTFRESGLKAK